jgi:ABC-type bacteriocin/lantibiotic exporter with double-glycine peptidase domain
MRRSLQLDTYSCGLQSCHIILDYYGKAGAVENLRIELGTDEEGTGEDEILEHFRKSGLAVNVIPKGTLADIRHAIDSGAPILAYTVKQYEHWFVIYGYSESRIYVLDPSLKKLVRCSMSKADFSRYWPGWLAAVYEKDSRYTDLTLSQNGGGAGLSISVKSKM